LRTEQWIKKLGGHASELYVCAELSKRGIPNALLPENFSDDDILIGDKAGNHVGFIQVKSCHPDRASTFILRENSEQWISEAEKKFCAFVFLGSPKTLEGPNYWIARKSEVGRVCVGHSAHGTSNWERRFRPDQFPVVWENQWTLFDRYCPP
jgi:hypothetical protein